MPKDFRVTFCYNKSCFCSRWDKLALSTQLLRADIRDYTSRMLQHAVAGQGVVGFVLLTLALPALESDHTHNLYMWTLQLLKFTQE